MLHILPGKWETESFLGNYSLQTQVYLMTSFSHILLLKVKNLTFIVFVVLYLQTILLNNQGQAKKKSTMKSGTGHQLFTQMCQTLGQYLPVTGRLQEVYILWHLCNCLASISDKRNVLRRSLLTLSLLSTL